MESKLAIHGGAKAIIKPPKKYNSIGEAERFAVDSVMQSGVLSRFLGCWDEDFYGGDKVLEFESEAAKYFGVKHAITVNSWTSGLIVAVGAVGVSPGDEVIVTPWTMCASATAILHWGAIPVFADIEPETFNIDPLSIRNNITDKTKAILAVDIFGHSCDLDEILKIADEFNLKVITDTAQAPGASYRGSKTGTGSHIGGFSLNYHKHIHTGEGGIITTNDEDLSFRSKLIRNHAEAVVTDLDLDDISNLVGYNFRLGEIESAIGIEQLKKLDSLVTKRQEMAERIFSGLKELQGIRLPIIKEGCSHAFYIFPMVLLDKALLVGREKIVKALEAEGVEGVISGYQNIHLLPIFQKKIAYGKSGFPWNYGENISEVDYSKGICPIAEELHDKSFIGYEMCLHELSEQDMDCFIEAFVKVFSNLDKL